MSHFSGSLRASNRKYFKQSCCGGTQRENQLNFPPFILFLSPLLYPGLYTCRQGSRKQGLLRSYTATSYTLTSTAPNSNLIFSFRSMISKMKSSTLLSFHLHTASWPSSFLPTGLKTFPLALSLPTLARISKKPPLNSLNSNSFQKLLLSFLLLSS